MNLTDRTYRRGPSAPIDDLLFSSDSHVVEPEGLWQRELPQRFRDKAPADGGRRETHFPGAMEKSERVKEMTADGVSGEVLYPSHGLRVLNSGDPELEAACARVYNDWLIDYCQAAPDRLVGIAIISVYDMQHAVQEMKRAREAGFRGVMIWQVPPPEFSFASDHYEPLWAAAQDLEMPVSLHILSGHAYSRDRGPNAWTVQERTSVNLKLAQSMDSLLDIIFSGVLERFPRLKIVLAENEIGWIPFVLEQWDYYYVRHSKNRSEPKLSLLPSEYFNRQIYATFFNDAVGARLLSWWGQDNCMWSSDYPHANSTWPNSREVVARDLGELPADARAKLVRGNVARLYGLQMPSAVALSAG